MQWKIAPNLSIDYASARVRLGAISFCVSEDDSIICDDEKERMIVLFIGALRVVRPEQAPHNGIEQKHGLDRQTI
jgi:hypothetical protein